MQSRTDRRKRPVWASTLIAVAIIAGTAECAQASVQYKWKEEYFEATKPLLNKGMWISLRGNYEACLLPERAEQWWLKKTPDKIKDRGTAWFYFFGYDEQVSCQTAATAIRAAGSHAHTCRYPPTPSALENRWTR